MKCKHAITTATIFVTLSPWVSPVGALARLSPPPAPPRWNAEYTDLKTHNDVTNSAKATTPSYLENGQALMI